MLPTFYVTHGENAKDETTRREREKKRKEEIASDEQDINNQSKQNKKKHDNQHCSLFSFPLCKYTRKEHREPYPFTPPLPFPSLLLPFLSPFFFSVSPTYCFLHTNEMGPIWHLLD